MLKSFMQHFHQLACTGHSIPKKQKAHPRNFFPKMRSLFFLSIFLAEGWKNHGNSVPVLPESSSQALQSGPC